MSDAILLEGVERRFGPTRVLRGAHVGVARGERVALVGPNGAGKSTLLRVAAGLLSPSAGRVRVLGRSPADVEVRARIGFLGHQTFLYGHLTARENLRFWARLYGSDDAGDRAAVLLERLGLDADDRRPVRAYSQGLRQRAGLARALVHDPEVLLLDEPFAALDEAGETAAAALIAEAGRTVLLATHHPDRVPPIADRALSLEAGVVHDVASTR